MIFEFPKNGQKGDSKIYPYFHKSDFMVVSFTMQQYSNFKFIV